MNSLSRENRHYFMGIAIIAVFLHHLCIRSQDAWGFCGFPFLPFLNGNIGVDLFLFASAYGCCFSWENNKIWKYCKNRLLRIYPQYILFLLIVLTLFLKPHFFEGLRIFVLSLLGLSAFNCFNVYVEWYVPALLIMYFVIVPIAMCIKNKKVLMWCIVLLLFACNIFSRAIDPAFAWRLPIIGMGIYAYLCHGDKDSMMLFFPSMALLSICTNNAVLAHSMIIPLVMLCFSFVDLKQLPLCSVFTFIGNYSFSVFLAQTITTQFFMFSFFWRDKYVSFAIVILLTTVLSFIFAGFQWLFDRIALKGSQVSR